MAALPADAGRQPAGGRRHPVGGGGSLVPDATPMSYYGRPIVKEPVWDWPIPAYLFTGGLAAGSALAGAGARLAGDRTLAGRSSWLSMGAIAASGGLLVYDLGRPERFYNMLRVLKPTSPMSVGTWIFSAFSAASGAGLAARVAGDLGLLGAGPAARVSTAGQLAAAGLAPALATYTAVLIADTAVPTWSEARAQLPWLFAGSASAAGAGAVTALGALTGAVPAGPRRLALAGAATEVALDEAMHRHLRGIRTGDAERPDLSVPLATGTPRRLALGARVATVAGAALLAAGGRRRALAAAGGLALVAGSALERFAIFGAGRAAAKDPVYTAGPQRLRVSGSLVPADGTA